MKNLILILIATLSLSAQAANYGKFRVVAKNGYYDDEMVVFLLNSNGKVKILENNDWFTVEASYFFGETTLSFRSGGDEDHVEGVISLKDNKATDGCAAFIDLKNEWAEIMSKDSFTLERWNKYSKKYESLYSSEFEFSSECEQEMMADYEGFEVF